MRDEIARSQGASVADVVDPTSRRRNEADLSISAHPSGTPRFFAPDASAGLSDGSTSDKPASCPDAKKRQASRAT